MTKIDGSEELSQSNEGAQQLFQELAEMVLDSKKSAPEFYFVASQPGALAENHRFLKGYLRRTYARADLLVSEAMAEIDLRREAEAPEVTLAEYVKAGQARGDLTGASVKAVRLILLDTLQFLSEKSGLSGEQLWLFFKAEMKFAFFSYRVSTTFKYFLEAEFRERFVDAQPSTVKERFYLSTTEGGAKSWLWTFGGHVIRCDAEGSRLRLTPVVPARNYPLAPSVESRQLQKNKVKDLLNQVKRQRFPRLSKEKFAEKMGVERSVFFALQRGERVSDETCFKVSEFTGIPIELLKQEQIQAPTD